MLSPFVKIVLLVPMIALGLKAQAAAADPRELSPTEKLVARVLPTVVAVHTMFSVRPKASRMRRDEMRPTVAQAEGSGFIVSPDGFIATNRHVIDDAYQVTVTLHDGATVDAVVAWKSSVVDVAFLKIKTTTPLMAVKLADYQNLRLGERVIAVGNPMGLGISVSAGVVSALHRNITQSPFDDFIQTDAAINHGSSGGPLFDEDGEVVGMNSVLFSSLDNGGSEGLGFAIPASDVTFLIDQLRTTGHVACGWLGVQGQTTTAPMRDALGYPGNFGVIVAEVEPHSAADLAGIRQGDVLRSLGDHPLIDVAALNRAACAALGKTVAVEVWREGSWLKLAANVLEADDKSRARNLEAAAPRLASASDLGLTLRPADEHLRAAFELPRNARGFVVLSVADSSEAEAAGLQTGDLIERLQGQQLSALEPFDAAFARMEDNRQHFLLALVQRKNRQLWVTLPVRAAKP